MLAAIYNHLGETELALERYLRLVEIAPGDYGAAFSAGLAFLNLQRTEDARGIRTLLLKRF